MTDDAPIKINVSDAPLVERLIGEHWGGVFKQLTPSMRPRGGKLGVNWMCVAPGRAAVPFHHHLREDEVFYILGGRGLMRHGDETIELKAGDCVACPAGTGVAHQIGNPYHEDLVYLAIGIHDAHEVCGYPDSGKVLVRGLQQVGRLQEAQYFDGEPDRPPVLGDG